MPKKSRDQQRKDKLEKRRKREMELAKRSPFALAYEGRSYKTDHFTPLIFAVESAINMADAITESKLTDRQVASGLGELVTQMQRNTLEPIDVSESIHYTEGEEVDLVIETVRRKLLNLSESGQKFSSADVQGCLRTLINSAHTWSTPNLNSRGYLAFLRGFLRRAGGGTTMILPEDDDEFLPTDAIAVHDLYTLGIEFAETGNPDIAGSLEYLARQMIERGENELVVNICQELLGMYPTSPSSKLFSVLSIGAQKAEK